MEGKPGAVGFVPPLVPWVYPCKLIKVDEDTGEPIRDENGLCVKCKAGQWGSARVFTSSCSLAPYISAVSDQRRCSATGCQLDWCTAASMQWLNDRKT